jgi:hypothetical protein
MGLKLPLFFPRGTLRFPRPVVFGAEIPTTSEQGVSQPEVGGNDASSGLFIKIYQKEVGLHGKRREG